MSLREEQRELTRGKIVGAVLDLVAEGVLDELSVPEVSRRCGVSVATIYRYFATKDDLLSAAAEEPARRALAAGSGPGRSDGDGGEDDYEALIGTMWRSFGDNLPLLRHQIASQAGREMREARTDRSREHLGAYIAGHGVDPDSPEGQRLVSLLLLVNGSLGLVELHDRQGLGIDESIAISRWALRALVDATLREAISAPECAPDRTTAPPTERRPLAPMEGRRP